MTINVAQSQRSKAETNHQPEGYQPEGSKNYFAKLLAHWKLVLFCCVLGIGGAVFVNMYTQDRYESTTTLLLRQETERPALGFNSDYKSAAPIKFNPDDQAGIVKSASLNLRTVNNLDWRVSIYEKAFLKSIDLFLSEPFIVEAHGQQSLMVPLELKILSDETFEISMKGQLVHNGIQKEVAFTKQGRFNEPFKNEYFNFTLKKSPENPPSKAKTYVVVFNDLSKLAMAYRDKLDVTLGDVNSTLLHIRLKSPQPMRDIAYLNELARVFTEFGMEEKNKIADNTLRFINHHLLAVTDSLKIASKDFTAFRSQNRIVDLGQEASLVVESLEQIEQEEAASRMKADYYKNLLSYLNDAERMKEMVAPSVVGITDPSMNSLVLKLTELYSERELLSHAVQEKNPDLLTLDNSIQYTRRILTENVNNLLNNTNTELRTIGDRKKKVNSALSTLPKKEQELVNIKRAFDLNNDLYTFLLRKRAEVGIARASNNPDVTILDTARFDSVVHLGPNKFTTLLLGLIAGLCIPFLAIVLMDYFDTRLQSPDHVEANAELAIAGRIYQNRFKTPLPVIQHQNSAVTESFRSLRSNVYFLLNDEPNKVVAVHSPIVGEGKSFVALNLSAILAKNNKRVLLVETDLRRQHIYQILKLSKDKGLSNLIGERLPVEEVIQQTKIKGLSFVSAGSAPVSASEWLNNPIFQNFVASVKSEFDFVVLDSVPTDIMSDAIIVGRYADINLMVLRMNYSKEAQLRSVNKLAYDGRMKNLALVLNDVSDHNAQKQFSKYGFQ